MQDEKRVFTSHNVMMEDRKSVMITGVYEVDSFDDSTVTLSVRDGGLVIRGDGLKIGGFNADKGELSVAGVVQAIVYTGVSSSNGGVLKRIFK